GQEANSKGESPDGGGLLGQEIHQRGNQQDDEDQTQPDGDLVASDVHVARDHEFARAGVLETAHDHGQAFENEAPDHADGVGVAQKDDVAGAGDDGEELEKQDQVEQAVGGAVARMRLAEPIGHDAVLADAVEHAIGADDGGVDRPGQDQEAHHDHEGVEQK